VGIACSLLVTGVSALGYLEFLQAHTLDLLLHVQGQRFPSEVVIVAIDDAAFESLGRRQPLSRAYLALLLQGLWRSGAAGGRTFASKKTRAWDVDELFLERLTRARGRAIITASRPTEVSIELPELGHGLFTYDLVQGLKGAADLNRDGIVSLQELYEYVEQQVTSKSRPWGVISIRL
jgi:hypothetical protein